MKSEDILSLFERFEDAAGSVQGIECWSARSLCPLLGYTDWRNFLKAIEKAKEACINAGEKESDHFVDANKMISLAKGAQRSVEDILLTRDCICSKLFCGANTSRRVGTAAYLRI